LVVAQDVCETGTWSPERYLAGTSFWMGEDETKKHDFNHVVDLLLSFGQIYEMCCALR
jgi:hypothetical protein